MHRDLPIDELRLRRFARLAAPLLRGAAAQGVGPQAARDRAGAGLEFHDLQPYTVGEDARHIDWRQTARRQKLVVRRYRDEAASDWFLCVDGSASMRTEGKWQLVTELATALSYALLHCGHRVGLAIFAERIHVWCATGRGQRQFASLVHELMDYEPPAFGGASLPGLCARSAGRNANVMLISDLLRADSMADDLRRLRAGASSADVIQVLGDEVRTELRGPAVVYDIESGLQRRVELGDTASSTAAVALDMHQQTTRRLLATLNMPITSCRAGDNWEGVLLQHLGT